MCPDHQNLGTGRTKESSGLVQLCEGIGGKKMRSMAFEIESNHS